MRKFLNPTKHTLNLAPLDLGTVAPGAEVEIPEEHYKPRRGAAGERMPSAIENMAPQLVPAPSEDPEWAAAWAKAPPEPVPVSVAVATTPAARVAPGIAQARAEFAQAKRGRPPKAASV